MTAGARGWCPWCGEDDVPMHNPKICETCAANPAVFADYREAAEWDGCEAAHEAVEREDARDYIAAARHARG